jgi:hypothetical protein
MPTTTTTTAPDHRPKGRPLGPYRSASGAERRLWRQQARDGLRLVDVPINGRGRRYLVERGLTEGELEALAEDYLANAAALGDCSMTRSRLDALVEALS